MSNNDSYKKHNGQGWFEAFIDQLLTVLFGELLIYIIILLFSGTAAAIIFASIAFGWGVLFLFLPFAIIIYALYKKYSR